MISPLKTNKLKNQVDLREWAYVDYINCNLKKYHVYHVKIILSIYRHLIWQDKDFMW